MDKVSIVIGLYNVSSFLKEKKLSCILQQTYSDIEIILVNDGSTDDTLAVCEELAATDNRIVIVNKENGGLGSARNKGLEMAIGTFVWFYDVDDEAEATLIEKNVQWMNDYQTDLNIFGYRCITPYLGLVEHVQFKQHLINDNDALKAIFIDELLMVPNGNGFAWNKFYRKSFIDKYLLRFGNQRIQQDEVFNLQIYPKVNRVYISSEMLYHYFVYSRGNTRSFFIKDRFEIHLSIFEHLKEFFIRWGLKDDKLKPYLYKRFYGGIESTILFNTFHPDAPYTFAEKRKVVNRVLDTEATKQCLDYMQHNGGLGIEQRCYLYVFARHSFMGIVFLRHLFCGLRKVKRLLYF